MKKVLFVLVLTYYSHVFGQNSDSLKIYKKELKNFALNFKPLINDEFICGVLPQPSLSMVNALVYLDKYDKESVKIYTCLIILKIYENHLETCHQSYELRNTPRNNISKNTFLYYCLKYNNYYKFDITTEFIPSSFIYEKIKAKELLINDSSIKKEVCKIDKIVKKIASIDTPSRR